MPAPDDKYRNRRRRNIALGLAIAAFVLLVYIVSIVKMGG